MDFDYMLHGEDGIAWNFNFRRNFFDWELERIARLFEILDSQYISRFGVNKRVWILCTSREFKVKSFYHQLTPCIGSLQAAKVRTFPAPPRVCAFGWTTVLDKILMVDLLRSWKILIVDHCALCIEAGESVDHLLMHSSNPISNKKIRMNSDMDKWSEVPNELLEMVLDCLPLFIDYIWFGAVCSSWYQVTIENPHWLDLQGQLPLMMLPDKEVTGTRNFYSITKNKLYNIRLPEFHGKWCCGSSKGWVVTVDKSSNIHLLNPFTSNQIQLPSLDKFPDDQNRCRPEVRRDYRYMAKALLSANPISTPDYIVVTIVTVASKLSFYKPGDEKWTTLNNQWGPYEDVIYYNDKFYAITNHNAVVTFDFASSDFPKFTVITPASGGGEADKRYLVEFSGRLLKVFRQYEWNLASDSDEDEDENEDDYVEDENEPKPPPEWYFRTVWFDVFELDQGTARDFPQCKGNCIYFTDANEDVPDMNSDNGVFSMEDKSVKPINSSIWTWKPLWVPPYFSK
ncbi:putative F-box protein At4g17565 isoform X2 [Tasmannia lanceolata]|uniref:putative F-box protein At4g17565 isoform X2 n=1 Tax=Tasmannia lanceolata TaxID=3420 RepID=UPI00406428AE